MIRVLLTIVFAAAVLIPGLATAGTVRQIYLADVSTISGDIGGENSLPAPTKAFRSGSAAYLYVLLNDFDRHAVSGQLRRHDGFIVKMLSFEVPFKAPAAPVSWRWRYYGIPLVGLPPGAYAIDLAVDGVHYDTLRFIIQ